jgi:hypothetical protein
MTSCLFKGHAMTLKPRFKSVKKPLSMFDSNLYEGTTALFGVVIMLSTPLIVLHKTLGS